MVLPHDSIYALSPWFVHDSIYALSPWFVPMVLPHDSIYALSPWFSPFCHVAGRPEHVDTIRSHRTHRRYYLRRPARELFVAT